MSAVAEEGDKPPTHAFVSIKVPTEFRHWLKQEAARQRVPMYRLLELLIAPGHGTPWRSSA